MGARPPSLIVSNLLWVNGGEARDKALPSLDLSLDREPGALDPSRCQRGQKIGKGPAWKAQAHAQDSPGHTAGPTEPFPFWYHSGVRVVVGVELPGPQIPEIF